MASHYRELKVWQKSMALVNEIYRITAVFPKEELYGLTSQIRRSAVSLPSNIAEGAARKSTKEFLRFISIAHGSLAELETQLLIAANQKYIDVVDLPPLEQAMKEIGKMLNGLQNSLNNKLATGHLPLETDI